MTRHAMKCWGAPFQAVAEGRKTFEFRRDDRDGGFQVNDSLHLREFDAGSSEYTGRRMDVVVRYIIRGPSFGVPLGYAVMSIEILKKWWE